MKIALMFVPLLLEGKIEDEIPPAFACHRLKFTSQQPGQPSRKRQAEPGSLTLLTSLCHVDIEDLLDGAFIDAGTLVQNAYAGLPVERLDLDSHLAVVWCVTNCVGQEVDQDLLYSVRIGPANRHFARHVHPGIHGLGLGW